MNRTTLRSIYNLLGSRRVRVEALRCAQLLNIPYYRIAIDTNNLCNLRCIMCNMALPDYREKPAIMSMELFERIAEQVFGRARVLDLSCGYEPFMTKGFIEYLRLARQYCKGQIGICTNALLVKEEIAEAIIAEELLDEMNISCDGLGESTYDSIRNGGRFDVLLSVLGLINRCKKVYGTSKPRLRLNYTMMKRNIEEIAGIKAFVDEYGFDVLQLRHVKLTEPFAALFDESLFYHQELSDEVMRKVIAQFKEDPRKRLIGPPLFAGRKSAITTKGACAYPWFNFLISSKGRIDMCDIGTIGDLANSTFRDIMKSERVKRIRRDILRGNFEGYCRDCYNVSDMESVGDESTFVRGQLQPKNDRGW
jgi:MoaA/NifB/PqqE/SkfB family radical SAM enzyme